MRTVPIKDTKALPRGRNATRLTGCVKRRLDDHERGVAG